MAKRKRKDKELGKDKKKQLKELMKMGEDQGFITQEQILEVFVYPELYLVALDDLYDDLFAKGVDVFETWSPVVQWSTVRVMMVLAAKLKLKSAQCDITAAFLHAEVPKDRNIFVHQPRGFRKHPDYVLKLNRFLYRMRDSPRFFFKYLSERLARQGLVPSNFDPCLFLSKDLIVLCYVDDLLVYAKTDEAIDNFVKGMVEEDVLLRKEDTAEGFLGVDIKRNGNKTTLTQSGLTKRIISALGLCSKYSTPHTTPAAQAALGRDIDGLPCSGTINYPSVVGMLLYLCGHSRPDIAFAVHQCARYNFEPKRSHVGPQAHWSLPQRNFG